MRTRTALSVIVGLALLVSLTALTGCNRSPKAQEAKFLKRAASFVAAKDYARATLELKNASRVMPNDAEPYYRQGLLELQTKNPLQALAYFKKALDLDPNHPGAKLKMAELLALSSHKEDVQEAAQRLTDFLQQSPDTAEASDSLAFTAWRLGKPEDAERLLSETLAKFPSRLESSVALARVKLAEKDYTGAEQVLQAAVKNAPQSSPAVMALASFYLVAGKRDLAEPQLKAALQLDPKNGSAWLSLAALQLQTGRKNEAEQTYQRLAAFPDRSYKPLHALFLFQDGRREEAIAEFERLAKSDPQDRDARGRLVAAYLATGQNSKAEQTLNSALARNSKDVDALLQRSRFYLAQGRNDDAERDLKQVLHFRGDSPDAYAALARLYHVTGKPLLEQQQLGLVLQLDKNALSARLELARSYTISGNAVAALEVLNEAPAGQRRTPALLIERNWALYALGRLDELRTGIAEGMALSSSPEWLLQSGLSKLSAGSYGTARIDAEEFLKKSPQDPRGAVLLAQTYLAQKQPQNAINRLRELTSQYPKSAALQQIYGDLLAQSGNRTEAKQAYLAARSAKPSSVEADLKLAAVEYADGRTIDAEKIIIDAAQRDPRNTKARLMLADIAQSAHRNNEAISQYRAVLEIDGANVMALNNLAYILAPTDPDNALAYAQKALAAVPDNATVQDTIGWIYCRKGIYDTALRYLRTSVDREPTPKRQFHLAITYIKSGDRGKGEALLALALGKEPDLAKTEQIW